MRSWRSSAFIAVCFVTTSLAITSPRAVAQDQAQESRPSSPWQWLKRGSISGEARFRFEAFEQDGPPFTAPAYAPTLRLALGYETPSFRGFSLFAQGEAVIITGPADFNDPTLPSLRRPDRPAILDPRSLELNQGFVRWRHTFDHKHVELRAGRQEMTLNDGRFLSNSFWRQVHGSFDAVKFDTELPRAFSFTYAFIGRFNREVGYDAIDGHPPMHTHMANLAWARHDQVNISLYTLLLDYLSPPQFSLSTQTYGLRATGPYQLSPRWSVLYTAEFAKQMNYGTNPYRVDANYYLGELGPAWRGVEVKIAYALLAGRNSTDLLTTPLAPPRNGWTDLFFNDPTIAAGSGLEARYVTAAVPVWFWSGTNANLIYYDYHSDFPRIHYGSELDAALAHKFKVAENRWEIGWRFSRYWADRLFTNAIRTSLYTSFTL